MERLARASFPTPKSRKSRHLVLIMIKKHIYFILFLPGSTVHYELVFSDDPDLPFWDPSEHVVLEAAPVVEEQDRRSCNTRKDRDKRQNRHTCGIFIG